MFVERYSRAVNSSDLRDDAHHKATMPLHASAWADRMNVLGSQLTRCKYADGTPTKAFEAGRATWPR